MVGRQLAPSYHHLEMAACLCFFKYSRNTGGPTKEKPHSVKCSMLDGHKAWWAMLPPGASRRRRRSPAELKGTVPQLHAVVAGRPAETASVQRRERVGAGAGGAPAAPCRRRRLAVPSRDLTKAPIAAPGGESQRTQMSWEKGNILCPESEGKLLLLFPTVFFERALPVVLTL